MTNRRVSIVLGCVSALFAAIVWSLPTWPFTDAPFRMAAATILRADNHAPGLLNQFFATRVDAFTPTSLFVVVAAWPGWPSVELATRVLLCVYVVSFPFLVTSLCLR
ncbi:MAG: hypothetical protein EHM13_12540, partial [Acidobacteria bacterium]